MFDFLLFIPVFILPLYSFLQDNIYDNFKKIFKLKINIFYGLYFILFVFSLILNKYSEVFLYFFMILLLIISLLKKQNDATFSNLVLLLFIVIFKYINYKYNLLSIEYNETKSYEIFYSSLFFGSLFFLTTIFYFFKIIKLLLFYSKIFLNK